MAMTAEGTHVGQNQAAYCNGKGIRPLEVKAAPYYTPGKNELLIRNYAAAVNPVDWLIQDLGIMAKFPIIMGQDSAGVVEAVGSDVTRFKKGDRVLSHLHGLGTSNPEIGGFQTYTLALDALTAHLPESLSYNQGSVLPLAISTAAAGLYQKDNLALPYPSLHPKPLGKIIVVYGASSSVGAAAVQLAVGSGLEVIAVASAKNEAFCKELGAAQFFAHNSSDFVSQVVSALKASKSSFAGIYEAISTNDTVKVCADITSQMGGGIISRVNLAPPPEGLPENVKTPNVIAPFIALNDEHKHVGKAVWEDFVSEALKSGLLKPKPDPSPLYHGLQQVQDAVDRQKKGVSAQKVVVQLD